MAAVPPVARAFSNAVGRINRNYKCISKRRGKKCRRKSVNKGGEKGNNVWRVTIVRCEQHMCKCTLHYFHNL